MGCFLPVTKKNTLQGLMYDSIDVTDSVADMSLNLQGFDPIDIGPRRAVDNSLKIGAHLNLLAGVLVTIGLRGLTDDAAAASCPRVRMGRVEQAFGAPITELEQHAWEDFASIWLTKNREIIATFFVKDMKHCVCEVRHFLDELHRISSLSSAVPCHTTYPLPGFLGLQAYLRHEGQIAFAVQTVFGSLAAGAGAVAARSAVKKDRNVPPIPPAGGVPVRQLLCLAAQVSKAEGRRRGCQERWQ